MRRFLFAVGLLATLAASQADAGYFIVRIILEGGAGAGAGGAPGLPGIGPGGSEGTGSPMAPPMIGSPMGLPMPPRGSGSGPPPMFGGIGGPMAGGAAPHDPTRSIFVVVPVTKSPEDKTRRFYPKLQPNPTYNPSWPVALTHPFGTTNLLIDSTEIQLYPEYANTPTATKTRTGVVLTRFEDWKRGAKDDTQKLLNLVTDALQVGLVDEAVAMSDELLTAVQSKKTTTPQVDRFVTAYTPLQKGLKARVTAAGPAAVWKQKLSQGRGFHDAEIYPSAHYDLIAWGGVRTAEANRRLEQLEMNLRAFYLWHATRGVRLPLPDQRLPVALTAGPDDVRFLASVLDANGVITDGFYAPDHELLVLSPDRVDEVGITFQRQVNGYYRLGVGRDRLLHPESYLPNSPIWLLNEDGQGKANGKKAAEVARMMTWAMADVFNQRDSEIASTSREGSRQLLHASGLLPRHVAAPAWLNHGSAEFFHRPRGPVYTDGPEDKTVATLGLTTGYGTANFAQQKLFRDLSDKKLLPADPAVLLRNVVTDTYFTAVSARLDADDAKLPKPKAPPANAPMPMTFPGGERPTPMIGPMIPGIGGQPGTPTAGAPAEDPQTYERRRQAFLVNKARSTSWALYHHLAANHADGLRRYFAELDKMPRDMPFDGSTNLAVFMTAFNLTTATPEAGKVPFGQFAREWLDTMATQAMTGVDLTLHAPAPPMTSNPTNPGGIPGFPPGGPGGPGRGPGS